MKTLLALGIAGAWGLVASQPPLARQESHAQGQFLIPMTLSLSAGLLVGMAASLVLTPVCYAILVGFERPKS